MDLITPGLGLLFWQTMTFLIVLFIVGKFAWKPIMKALHERESNIADALNAASEAKEEMAKLNASNEQLMAEARIERDNMLKDAKKATDAMIAEAKETASKEGDKMLTAAKEAIEIEKKAAMAEVKNQVASVSLEVAEKLLRKELSSKDAQKDLVESLLGETSVN